MIPTLGNGPRKGTTIKRLLILPIILIAAVVPGVHPASAQISCDTLTYTWNRGDSVGDHDLPYLHFFMSSDLYTIFWRGLGAYRVVADSGVTAVTVRDGVVGTKTPPSPIPNDSGMSAGPVNTGVTFLKVTVRVSNCGGGGGAVLTFTDLKPPPDAAVEQNVDALALISAGGIARVLETPGLPESERAGLFGRMKDLLVRANLKPIDHSAKVCSTGSGLDLKSIHMLVNGDDVTKFALVTPVSGTPDQSCASILFRKYWLSGTITVRVTAKAMDGTFAFREWQFGADTHYIIPTIRNFAIDRILGKPLATARSALEALFEPTEVF